MSLLACQQPSFDSGFFGRSSVSLSVCLLTVCLAVCLFSHLLHRLTTSICPVSQRPLRSCSVLSLSLSPFLQIQAFNVQSNKFASASDCATFLTPAILMGLVTSLILLLVLAYALHMVVHLKHIDRYEEHKATVYFPRSPEAELPDKNSLWRRKKKQKKNITKGGTERRRTGDEEQVNWGMKKSILHWRVLKSKWQLLPVRMKSLVFTTLCQRRKPWMDTFSSYFVDLHLCIHEFRKPSLREGSRP